MESISTLTLSIRHVMYSLLLPLAIMSTGCAALPRMQLYAGEKRPDESICLVKNHPWMTSVSLTKKSTGECVINTNAVLGKLFFEVEPGEYEVRATATYARPTGAQLSAIDTRVFAGKLKNEDKQMSSVTNHVYVGTFEAKPNRIVYLYPNIMEDKGRMFTVDHPNNAMYNGQ